ncbi:MAG: eco57IR: type restriction enzyme Eco57I, partial [Deltaproteobacteria bacterium]|nr:eco57IR: type restriction enzyme Eco57I [Deltaproteobacteria bacterium]
MIEDARNKITELIERFDRNSEVYRSGNYNETQVRREFIDPFFDALGWDVANKAGYAEQYKDVVHEDSIKVGVSLKAPDYSFRIGGQRKFFLEAKKPQVRIKEDVGPAYQLRRYAWSAKLPLSIVTDFEEFAVYDCRVKPDSSDKVSLGRIAYYTYDQYLEKFDEIYDTFSKEAVLKGSFDRYIESTKVKKGTGEVDREFLKEIEKWRDSLARNLAIRNPELDIYELNFAVQHTIDRIIFLRICEDRGIEGYGRLQGLLNGASVYERLLHLFTQADKKYNSGLFDFKADRLSHNLKIDDKVLKEIIENLYYPKSPYEFSVLGADILGNVYEQFLGKVIRLTAGHQAKVEEKPEVKKAGGVYYTPQYIVEYIVKNTVGRLLGDTVDGSVGAALSGRPDLEPAQTGQPHRVAPTNITPKDVSKIRILDPACGSGSFLIGAYQYLLDWHLKWYRENDTEKHARGKTPAVYLGTGKEWRLTTQEKKRILLNNIYGVDIDRQAVEVTKLSLLLKLLENENEETVGKTMALFQERVLPSLENNIKCGNSLIGPDFYNSPSLPLLKPTSPNPLFSKEGVPKAGAFDDDIRRINVFDWEKEFPEIMKTGGFDAVIGNPPYVRQEMLGEFKPY